MRRGLAVGIVLWCLGAYVAHMYGAGPIYVLVSPMVLICFNLGERKSAGEVSAYSVFNKDFARMPGTLTMGQIDAQLRHTDEDQADAGSTTTGVIQQSFFGAGRQLGSAPSPAASWLGNLAASVAAAAAAAHDRVWAGSGGRAGGRGAGPRLDPTLPTLAVRVRVAGAQGEHTVTFNTTHTVQDLLAAVREIARRERGGRAVGATSLVAGYPPARLDEASTATLQEAGLANALVREVVDIRCGAAGQ